MDLATILYLGVTVGLFVVFVLIAVRTFSRKRKDHLEAAKYRMMDDDE